MQSLLLVVSSFVVTILGWGLYVPMLQWGQRAMSETGVPARWRPFMCVGLAYFLIGVIVPILLLRLRGERGEWTVLGIIYSLLAGTLGALGALGIILAINFGGNPIYVAPLVFGLAPVVNSFLTIFLARKMREIGPFFLAGLIMVLMGAVTVLLRNPASHGAPHAKAPAAATAAAAPGAAAPAPPRGKASSFFLQVLAIAMVGLCWGAYGPTLHKGQSAMLNSRLRPFLCVGLAYFLIAVLVPPIILAANPEASSFAHVSGTMWSLLAGSAGAVGALGIIMAFNFGGKPIYVMPLIFGGAPVVATLVSIASQGLYGEVGSVFVAGLMLVIAGAAMVLVFAPKGGPPAHAPAPAPKPTPPADPAEVATQTWRNPSGEPTQPWPQPGDENRS
jgi:hypothetical protein